MMSLEETPPDAWLGINEAIYYEFCDGKENTIVSSVAKINESYLREASDSQKQYVVRLGTPLLYLAGTKKALK